MLRRKPSHYGDISVNVIDRLFPLNRYNIFLLLINEIFVLIEDKRIMRNLINTYADVNLGILFQTLGIDTDM